MGFFMTSPTLDQVADVLPGGGDQLLLGSGHNLHGVDLLHAVLIGPAGLGRGRVSWVVWIYWFVQDFVRPNARHY